MITHLKNQTNYNARMLAMRAIQIVEQAIEHDFGYRVRMGAELEFCAFSNTNPTDWNPLKIPDDRKQSGILPDYLEPYRPHIHAFYKESTDNQYEIVFNHQAPKQSLIELARAIDFAKKRVTAKGPEEGVDISFDAVAQLNIFNGLHLNFSLVDAQGKNGFIYTQNHFISEPSLFMNRIGTGVLKTATESMLLYAPNQASYERFNPANPDDAPFPGRLDGLEHFAISLRNNKKGYDNIPDSERIENRIAGADADPFAIILTTLAGIYHALKCQRENQAIVLTKGQRVPRNLPQAIEEFRRGRIIPDILNELSHDQLGDRFQHIALLEAERAQQKVHEGAISVLSPALL